MQNAANNVDTLAGRKPIRDGYDMIIQTTWRFPEPKMTVSQKHAIAIKAIIDTSKTTLSTAEICDKLSISRGQFQAAKPYFRDYKSIGCNWYAPESAESAKKRYDEEKRLLAIARNAFHNGQRRKVASE